MHALKLVVEIAVLPLRIYVGIPWQCLDLGLLYYVPYKHRCKDTLLGQMFKSQQTSAGILAELPAFRPPDLGEKQPGAQLSSPLSSLFGSSCNL